MTEQDEFLLNGPTKPAAPGQRVTETEVRQALALAERMKLTGIGGWLAAFYILYGFGWFYGLGLLYAMSLGNGSGALNAMGAADWVGRVVVAVCMFAAHNSSSTPMRVGQIAQIACAVAQLILGLSSIRYDVVPLVIMLLLVIAYHTGWFFYFKNSLRVKYTYDERIKK